MKKILIIFGTRPELIKLFPVYRELKKKNIVETCFTGQHDKLINDIINEFKIKINYRLKSLKYSKNLHELISYQILNIKKIILSSKSDLVIIQGDTATTFSASISAFLLKKKIAYIESGLRTFDKYSPFPEEIFRQNVSRMADYHFCPTYQNKKNLLYENINKKSIFVTGNTIVDAINLIKKKLKKNIKKSKDKYFLVTLHRRELNKNNFLNILKILDYFSKLKKIKSYFIIHENPNFKKNLLKFCLGKSNFKLIKPLNYIEFIKMALNSEFIVTDSGGISEEGPTLKKKVFVVREKTERNEVLSSGYVSLIGTNPKKILSHLSNYRVNKAVLKKTNPIGDGKASRRIFKIINKMIWKKKLQLLD